MDKDEFESLFDEIVSTPLLGQGFERRGKALFLLQDQISVSLIRLGGRMAVPSSVSHVLCFRHRNLPTINESMNSGFEREVFSYPIKVKPLEVSGFLEASRKYHPHNLRYPKETIEFANKSETEAQQKLGDVLDGVRAFVQWAETISVEEMRYQIKKYGESAWIEKKWLSAYVTR